MADVDHAGDLKKYAPSADPAVVGKITKHLGIAMKSVDSQLVSCSSKSELERVRESWCKGKLKLTQSDAEIDKAIQEVCETMKADRSKSRIVFYYLLAEKYGKVGAL
jgi:hypothetical protein